jgi:SAM-dependent methyltransferase
MIGEKERIAAEIAHGRFIHQHHPEVWDWSTPAGQVRARRRARLLCEFGRLSAADRLLELGCGTGLFTELVQRATGASIIATDLSPELLAEARERLPQVEFRIEDAHRLSFPDACFDAVYGSSILHHLEIGRALDEIRRVLRPGGRMVFVEPNMLNPQILVQKKVPAIKRWAGDVPHETAFVRWEIARRLRRHGFVAVVTFPHEFLHPFVPRALIGWVSRAGAVVERLPLLREIGGSCVIAAEKPA